VNWAAKVGPYTARLVQTVLDGKPHPEMGYRACMGVIRLAEKYSLARMECAAERAILTGAVSYKSVESILRTGLDSQPSPPSRVPRVFPEHENLRGPEYFQ
jgi:transposase